MVSIRIAPSTLRLTLVLMFRDCPMVLISVATTVAKDETCDMRSCELLSISRPSGVSPASAAGVSSDVAVVSSPGGTGEASGSSSVPEQATATNTNAAIRTAAKYRADATTREFKCPPLAGEAESQAASR